MLCCCSVYCTLVFLHMYVSYPKRGHQIKIWLQPAKIRKKAIETFTVLTVVTSQLPFSSQFRSFICLRLGWLSILSLVQQIPIYKGADRNLVGESMCAVEFHGEGGLGGVSIPNQPAEGDICREEHAVTALLRLTKERPGEITLLAIGPLTNVALAIRLDPGFTKRLKSLIIMGGDIAGE